jgi:hypothetical protein
MCRGVRAVYGDLIFVRDVAGAFVAGDRIDGRSWRGGVDLSSAAIFGLCSLSRQSIHRF